MKALAVISCATLAASPSVSTQVIFCSHHPCMVGTAKRDVVWKVALSPSLYIILFSKFEVNCNGFPGNFLSRALISMIMVYHKAKCNSRCKFPMLR